MMKYTKPLYKATELISQGIQPGRFTDEQGVLTGMLTSKNLEGLLVTGEPTVDRLRQFGIEQYRVQEGDILLLNRGSTPKVSMVPVSHSGALVGQNLVLIRPTKDVVPLYLAGLLRSQAMQPYLAALYTGATIPVLGVAKLKELEIPVPDREVQERLAELFEGNERFIRASHRALEARQVLIEAAVEMVVGGKVQ